MTHVLAVGEASGGLVLDLLVILATAGLVAALMQRLRLAVVPAYLLAGALVGPDALGFVRTPESVDSISRLAIILLLFGIGMQLHLPALKGNLRAYLIAGVGSSALSIALGVPLALAFGVSASGALAIAMALSLSSTAVVLRILSERRELSTPHGRLSFAILIVQDLLVLGMLALIPLLGDAGRGAVADAVESPEAPAGGALALLGQAALRIGGITALIVIGRLALPPLLREAARGRSGEVMMVLSIAAAIGAAIATERLGFSAELGAFLAGFLLSGTPFKHQLSGQIGPLRDLFIAVFFTTVGMSVDPALVASSWWVVLLATLAMLLVKTIAIAASAWAVGTSGPASLMTGLALAQGGEFSLIVLKVAETEGALAGNAVGIGVAVVVLSLMVTPGLISFGRMVSPRVKRAPKAPWVVKRAAPAQALPASVEEASGATEDREIRRVIVAGFGPVGRAISENLAEENVEVTIVDLNPQTVRTQTGLGRTAIYGDASNPEVLESAGLRDADAVILTIPDDAAVIAACQVIRKAAPDVFIAARTDFLSRGMLASGFGADLVTVDELATAEVMQRDVMKRLRERRLPPAEECATGSPEEEPGSESVSESEPPADRDGQAG
jgi:CPA2 family monovalent cation:H+ antiporter-2